MNMKKILFIGITAAMIITAITPIALAATSDTITVTFDTTGTIDIDVAPESWDAGSLAAQAGHDSAYSGDNSHTVWNNGSVSADLQIQGTDTSNLVLVTSWTGTNNEFRLNTTPTPTAGDFFGTSLVNFYSNLGVDASHTFGLYLELDEAIDAEHTDEQTTVTIQGSAV